MEKDKNINYINKEGTLRATAEELGTAPVTLPQEELERLGKITLFEALSQNIDPDSLDLSNSNHTTQPPADYDDQ